MPALGLSNKALFDSNDVNEVVLSGPPTEEVLTQSTLWPETEKL